jgi:putative ABC transport system substrate-binding protein
MLRIFAFLVASLTASAVALPLAAADRIEPERVIVYLDAENPRVTAAIAKFEEALKRRGITTHHRVLVRHVAVDVFNRAQSIERISAALRKRPALVIATSSETAAITQSLTSEVPVVFGSHQDPIRVGLVRSLAEPGGNLTGFTFFVPIDLKRLELLREIAPRARRLGILIDHWWMQETDGLAILGAAQAKLGFEGRVFLVEKQQDLSQLQSAAARDIDVWYVPPTALPFQHPSAVLHALATLHKPAVFPDTMFVEGGGLLAYQPKTSLEEALDLFAKIAGLILDGVPPADIPIERPKSFELLVNASEARRLGISLPPALLKRADRVIDEPVAR